jgi:D-alanyl-lipoteichoic acid acyltransferase DltB (MBOAT superfamily)
MLFNSWEFLIFFPLITVIYFLLPKKFRNPVLLAASCYFYMSYIPVYIFILFFLITLDFTLGIIIESAPKGKKYHWLVLSIAANVFTLLFFKYFDFFTGHSILLPIGLSFHTLQSMSYVIEVARGRQKAERNYLTYSLFVMFYPQLVAGPIERPQTLLKQFYDDHKFELNRVLSGATLMLVGFYKKVVIADYISVLVDPVFKNPSLSSGTDILLAGIVFPVQIYCDFSGYSDIARGAAKIMGFELSLNFNQPFNALNITELWNRWHISLYSWFRDYVYIPLGGSQRSNLVTCFNMLLVFLLSGLWHGTGWGFIVWAELNGVMVTILYFTADFRKTKSIFQNKILSIAATYLFFSFTAIFFRSPSIGQSFDMVSRLLTGGAPTVASVFNVMLTLALIFSLESIHFFERNELNIKLALTSSASWLRWSIYYVCTVSFLLLTYLSLTNQNVIDQPFIYFQF